MSGTDEAAAIFADRAARYDRMVWHDRYARGLVATLDLVPGLTVVDAGAGTGFASRALARRLGSEGRVLAVDLTPAMLDRLDVDADPMAAPIDAVVADASRLDLADESVDAVVCSAALLYMPVEAALREWGRVVRPGGIVAFSTMRKGQPPAGALFRRLAREYGLRLPDPAAPLGSERDAAGALTMAGLADPRVIRGTVEFADADLAGAWEAHERGARDALQTLSVADRAELRARYVAALGELEDRHTAQVLYAQARRPGAGRQA